MTIQSLAYSLLALCLGVAGLGCQSQQSERRVEMPAPPARISTPPQAKDVASTRRTEKVPAETPVTPVSYNEPDTSKDAATVSTDKQADGQTPITAQAPVQPGSANPEQRPGAVPPPPPKALPAVAGSPPSIGGPLGLDEVLGSVERHYPLLRAVEQERLIAGGRLVSSMGAFDLNFNAGADGQGTTYDNIRSNVGFSQNLPFGGVGMFAGYRNGYGDFTTYNLGQKTADGGEFRTGLTIPLLRDRSIDRTRATVQQAQIDLALAEPVTERQRLDYQRAAARTYWSWVAAGQRLKVAESLVKLAVERDEQLKARVEVGPIANIERIDNQQNIALRNGVVVQAQRAFQQVTIDLSLFLRDESGSPTLAGTDRLPKFPEVQSLDPKEFDAALQTAFESRPEPRRLRLQRDKAMVDLRLALNQALPSMNAVVAASQDVGYGKSSLTGPNGLDRTSVSLGVAFQLPVQQRDARGKAMVAQAQLAQIEHQLRQIEDVVRSDVQDSFSAVERAYEFYQQAKKRVELARMVARAEREQLRLGRSDILRVTLREQAAFDAEVVEIGAQQDYFRSQAEFRAAQGIGGK
ncbi:MAG: TolC family protein [Gemmataceae bacterium]